MEKQKNGKEKQFRKWKYSNEHFIQLVSSSVRRTPDELVPSAVTGGQIEIIRGTYVHSFASFQGSHKWKS